MCLVDWLLHSCINVDVFSVVVVTKSELSISITLVYAGNYWTIPLAFT